MTAIILSGDFSQRAKDISWLKKVEGRKEKQKEDRIRFKIGQALEFSRNRRAQK